MCAIYLSADPILYESRTRSLRINGVLTTIRLENLFWDVLAEMSAKEGRTTNQLITTLHEELFALRGESPNFTSFLRVCCLRYLSVKDNAADTQRLVASSPASSVINLHGLKPATH